MRSDEYGEGEDSVADWRLRVRHLKDEICPERITKCQERERVQIVRKKEKWGPSSGVKGPHGAGASFGCSEEFWEEDFIFVLAFGGGCGGT